MPGSHVVLGVTPGVRSLAYVVLDVRPGVLPSVLDFDVLKGGKATEETIESEVRRKAGIALKILGVVIERAPPAVLAVGPPAPSKIPEPALHVEACRLLLRLLVRGLREHGLSAVYVEWRSPEELARALGAPHLQRVLSGKISNGSVIRGKPLQLAAAAALAGVSHET